ncbi:MAG: dephospho-CoA kinase [Syntrophomonas sp.]|nr:dephospho-CoA kinase [Syntrophomonas sp.]
MKIIGLTGGIASGKSTVAKILTDLGAWVIDADKTGHRLMEPYQSAWKAIVQTFGPEILNPDMTINRLHLGSIVFSDHQKLQMLNDITHPLIGQSMRQQIKQIRSSHPEAVIFLDVPLLYETNMDKKSDQVWVVWVDRETQLNRLIKRDGFTRQEALRRIDSQMSLDEKAERADVIINNTNSIDDTIHAVTKNYNSIL